MKPMRLFFIFVAIVIACPALSWFYTMAQLAIARSQGIYDSPEAGMLALVEESFTADHETRILYAGPHQADSDQPYIWYITAEVRSPPPTADGAAEHGKCDAPGSYFLQTQTGWVHMPEGALPKFVGFWMGVFQMAGPGQTQPTTSWAPAQPQRFCR